MSLFIIIFLALLLCGHHYRCHTVLRHFFAIMILTTSGAYATAIIDVPQRLITHDDAIEVRFPVSQKVSFSSFRLDNPPRLVIDIPQAQLRQRMTQINLSGTYLKQIRLGTQQGTDLRIVLDLTRLAPATSALIKTQQGYELAVYVGQGSLQNVLKLPQTTKVVTKQADIQVARSVPKKNIIIVIDPGHGGKDPGAVGKVGREKDIVLSISKQLRDMLNKQSGFKAVLTRNENFIPLRERILLAKRYQADMFISVHADAGSKTAKGASVYVLSTKGASSEAARLLAQKENQSDLVGGVKISDKDAAIASMLLDLSQEATIEASHILGQEVLVNLRKTGHLHKSAVERAAFAVLKSPDIPSVLIETGFISNPAEEKKLLNAAYQKALAQSIQQGIISYFKKRPASELVIQNSKARVSENSQTNTVASVGNAEIIHSVNVTQTTPSQPTATPISSPVVTQPQPQEIRFPPLEMVANASSNQRATQNFNQLINQNSKPLASKTNGSKPVVKSSRQITTLRGETLSEVAKRAKVNLSQLRKHNQLPANQLRVPAGTVLQLP